MVKLRFKLGDEVVTPTGIVAIIERVTPNDRLAYLVSWITDRTTHSIWYADDELEKKEGM